MTQWLQWFHDIHVDVCVYTYTYILCQDLFIDNWSCPIFPVPVIKVGSPVTGCASQYRDSNQYDKPVLCEIYPSYKKVSASKSLMITTSWWWDASPESAAGKLRTLQADKPVARYTCSLGNPAVVVSAVDATCTMSDGKTWVYCCRPDVVKPIAHRLLQFQNGLYTTISGNNWLDRWV